MMARWLSLSVMLLVCLLPAADSQTLMDILFGSGGGGGSGSSSSTNSISSGSGSSSIGSISSISSSQPSSGPVATLNSLAQAGSGGSRSSSSSSLSSLGSTGASSAHCTTAERNLLFGSCAMSFGMQHMLYFSYLSSRRTCDTKVFRCSEVDKLVRCVNSQTTQQVSNRCWPIVESVLTGFFGQYNLPCTFQDIKSQCMKTSADFLPMDQRQQHGQGMDSNPMRIMIPMIASMMDGGGGMGALFGA